MFLLQFIFGCLSIFFRARKEKNKFVSYVITMNKNMKNMTNSPGCSDCTAAHSDASLNPASTQCRTSETAFECCFACGPIVTRLKVPDCSAEHTDLIVVYMFCRNIVKWIRRPGGHQACFTHFDNTKHLINCFNHFRPQY